MSQIKSLPIDIELKTFLYKNAQSNYEVYNNSNAQYMQYTCFNDKKILLNEELNVYR